MNIRQNIEENPILWFICAIIAAFGAGFGTYKAILEVANLDTVQEGSYFLKEEFTDSFIQWDPLRKQYVLSKNKDRVVVQLQKNQIVELHNLDMMTRSIIHTRFERLQNLAAIDFEKNEISPIIQASIDAVPLSLKKNAIFDSKQDKEKFRSWLTEVMVKIILQRDKILKRLMAEENERLTVVNESAARWVPSSATNVAILNLREMLNEYLLTEFDLLLVDFQSFLENNWVPKFTINIMEKPSVAKGILDTQGKPMERLELLYLLLEAIFFPLDKKYKEQITPINEDRQRSMQVSEMAFLSLLLGEIKSSEYRQRVRNQVELAKKKNMEMRKSLMTP